MKIGERGIFLETTRGVFVPLYYILSPTMRLKRAIWVVWSVGPGSITTGWIAKKFGAAICVAQRKNPNDFLDPLTFPLAPP